MRRVKNGGGQQRAVSASIGDSECAACQVLQAQFAVTSLDGKIQHGFFNAAEIQLVNFAEDGYNETPFAGYGDAYVVIVVVDNIVTFDAGVDHREALQGFDCGFDEKRHEPQLYLVFLLEAGFVLVAHFKHFLHVDLIEGGQGCRVALGFKQPFRNSCA